MQFNEGGELQLLPEVESNQHHIIAVIISCHLLNVSTLLQRNPQSLLSSLQLLSVKSMHSIILSLTQKTLTQQISPRAHLINLHNAGSTYTMTNPRAFIQPRAQTNPHVSPKQFHNRFQGETQNETEWIHAELSGVLSKLQASLVRLEPHGAVRSRAD